MVKSTTDKLVPASMVQNEPVFKLHRDVVDTMISGADDIVYHKRASDNKTTYYFGQGSEVSTEYDEHGNMTKQQGKDATMGNFEQTFENTYDDNGNLISMKSAYNGDDGYFIDYTYAALNDASYNGEGTLLFDAATDTPSAA